MKRTELKRTKRIKPMSARAIAEQAIWKQVKLDRAHYLIAKYGYLPCEYCGATGRLYWNGHEDWLGIDPHHIDKNRRNNSPENCYLVHRKCHTIITDNNIRVSQEDFQGQPNITMR